jgi:thiamine-phosphate diphosphorylase/hydroxyethylthiazole kinase
MTDYTLYLVTDSTLVHKSSTFLKQVEDSINNGATIVQLREKSLLTFDFIKRAEEVHKLTKAKNIPLIINDRVDVALAIDAEGVHVGQDDMPAQLARKLLGPSKILGVTCSNPKEVEEVVKQGVADYVGLGTVYPTATKTNVSDPEGTGPIGIRKMLQVLKKHNQNSPSSPIKCVAIGGINHFNASKVLYQCEVPQQKLDGLAVVSCIMSSSDAGRATKELKEIIKSPSIWDNIETTDSKSDDLSATMKCLTHHKPMVHHITNNVVKNFSANVCLAIGASPIMSELTDEYREFSLLPNIGLLMNLGTPSTAIMDAFLTAMKMYNSTGKPIVFDPVAGGASKARLQCCRKILNAGQVSVIKGNVGEISAIFSLTSDYDSMEHDQVLMRGVDSNVALQPEIIIKMGKRISNDFKCVVVVTGPVNYVIDHDRHCAIPGGDAMMGHITGTGCSLGSVITAILACGTDKETEKINLYNLTVSAVELYNIAGKRASDTATTPGSFLTDFIDALYTLTHKSA